MKVANFKVPTVYAVEIAKLLLFIRNEENTTALVATALRNRPTG